MSRNECGFHDFDEEASFLTCRVRPSRVVRYVLELLGSELTSHIDKDDHDRLVAATKDGGIVAGDGTMWGTEKYQQIDPGWALSLIHYTPTHFLDSKAKFSTRQVEPISLSGRSADEVKIAVVGDWGTGDYPHLFSIAVMDQIEALKPDYIIHLGDVYYAGTDNGIFHQGEEQENFLNIWPKDIPSFTMNSNHEMYDGARGYFEVALEGEPFSLQQETSYFALQYAGWTLIGLDSCYWSKSPLFMTGSLSGGEDTTQADWIRSLGLSPDKTIVMTHHNGLTYQGDSEPAYDGVTLWSEINDALGGDPAAWYWGHIHNAMVYKTPTFNGKQTRARCLGHGALPFGDAWGIQYKPDQIEYYAHTPNKDAPPRHMRNGFAVLTMKSDGQVTEEFFDQSNTTAMYSGTYG